MILRVHHAQIPVPVGAEGECRKFYCEVLGLNEIPKPAELRERGGFWLELDGMQIHIGMQDDADRARSRAHLAYEVESLAAWRAKLKENGIEVLDAVSIPGFDRFEFRDPFGNRIEFLQRLN